MSCSDCNTHCEHCYISYKGNFQTEQLEEVIDNLLPKYNLKINGTEPLIHPEFLPFIKKINQKTVLTNGLVFKDNYDYIDQLKTYGIENIAISYHFELHDLISKVDKSYLENLFKIIIDKGLNVVIMTTLSSVNYKNLEEYCEFCKTNNIHSIRFTNYLRQGSAKNMNDKNILSQQQIMDV